MTQYRIKYKDAAGNEQFANITDGTKIIQSDDKVHMDILAGALNRLKMTPDEQYGTDFEVVEVSKL